MSRPGRGPLASAWALAFLLVLLAGASSGLRAERPGAPAAGPERRLVIGLSIDGLRPDAWERADTPNLDALAREGAVARLAETVSPSVTLPSHTSMITGVHPQRHGVLWNNWEPERGVVAVATAFQWIRHPGRIRTSLFAGKEKFRHLDVREHLDAFDVPGYSSARVVKGFLGSLPEDPPTGFHFLHFPEADGAGHTYGWMSDSQLQVIEGIDAVLGTLRTGLSERGLAARISWLITADHGGHGKTHGTNLPEDKRVPFVLSGSGVKRGYRIEAPVSVCDLAPTATRLLGRPVPPGLDGRVLAEALSD